MVAAKQHYPRTQHRLCLATYLAALLLCAASVGLAQAPSNPAAASFEVQQKGGGSAGSGTAIHPQIVVTNSHVVNHRNGGLWTVRHPVTKQKTTGKCFAVDRTNDIALIKVNDKLPYVLLDARGLREDRDIERFGNGLSGGLRRILCRLKRKTSLNHVSLTRPSVAGDSGGGCFINGMYCGSLHSTNGDTRRYGTGSETYATDARQVVKLVAKYDKDAQTRLFGRIFGNRHYQGCPPGGCPIPQGQDGIPKYREKIDIDDIEGGDLPVPKLDPAIEGHKHDFEIDIEAIAQRVVALMPPVKDGEPGPPGPTGMRGKDGNDGADGVNGINGADGKDGRGVDRIVIEFDDQNKPLTVVYYTDGTRQVVDGLGITIEMYDDGGKKVDSEYVPLGGTLKLRQKLVPTK